MTSRVRHYIRGNTKCEIPSLAIFVDTETHAIPKDEKTVENVLTFGWACHIRRKMGTNWTSPVWWRFDKVSHFWRGVEALAHSKSKLYIFCHNTNFDLPVLRTFSTLKARGWKLHKAVIEGPPTILEWRKDGATICIIDTLNFWRQPLASLGKSVGLRKLKMPPASASQARWDAYCRRDVKVLVRSMLRWWNTLVEQDFGGFAPTIASQSFRIWRHRHMKHQVLIHDDMRALALERACYYGGRNEAFRLGKIKGKVYYVDIKSAYPAVMRSELFPARLAGFAFGSERSTLPLLDRGYGVAAEVLVNTQQPIVPRLFDGKLCFPIGTFWAALTGPEIREVLKVGEIRDVGWSGAWVMEPLFRTFVDELFTLRKAALERGDDCQALFFKILMNSLYGKFGQNGFKWDKDRWEPNQPDGSWIEYDYPTRETRYCRRLSGLTQRKRRDAESRESVPIIAAYVTAYQRIVLLNLIRVAGFHETLYCDTDGLLVTAKGYTRLKPHMNGHGLGSLELKGIATNTEIRGLKDYTFGDEFHVKGVRPNATWVDPYNVVQQQWSGLKGQALRGAIDVQTIRQAPKHLSRQYTKGKIQQGGVVTPLVFDETSSDYLLPRP